MRKSLVLVMDILGFSDLIMDSENRQALLLRFWKATNDLLRELKPEIQDQGLFAFKAYTDNVLIAMPVDEGPFSDGESQYGFITFDAAWYQLNLALRGWFVRGAVTLGEVFVGDDIVFGAPIVEGHRLESKVAKYPRIILSDDVVNLANGHLKYYAPGASPHQYSLMSDGDITFINYLSLIFDGSMELEESEKALTAHKRKIEENLSLYGVGDNKIVLEKFRWLAGYHNKVVATFEGRSSRHRVSDIRPLPLEQFGA